MSDYSHGREKAKVKALRAGMPEYERDLADELSRRAPLEQEHADELRRYAGAPAAPNPGTVRVPEASIQTLPTMTTVLQGPPAPMGGMPDHSAEALPVMPRPERPSGMPDVSALAAAVPAGAWVGDPQGRTQPGPGAAQQPTMQDLQNLLQPNRDVLATLGQ